MDVLEPVRSGLTQTHFGRHYRKLNCLEEALKEASFHQHSALVIGAGLHTPLFLLNLEDTPLENDPNLQKPYSWEPVELAAVLERLGKPYNITVVDSSQEVCEALAQQQSIVIDDCSAPNDAGFADYAMRFLATFGIMSADKEKMEAINNAIPIRHVADRLKIFKKVEIPQQFRDRIEVVAGSVANLARIKLQQYNVITCFNVMMYVPGGFEPLALESIASVASDRCVAAADFRLPGFKDIKVFEEEVGRDDSRGGPYTNIHGGYISVKEAKEAKQAQHLAKANSS